MEPPARSTLDSRSVTTNPFEPPRTRDLESRSEPGHAALSEEALTELSASAASVRWFARVTTIWLLLAIAEGAVALFTTSTMAYSGAIMINVPISLIVSGMFVAVLRRYASAAERLRGGTRHAAIEVIFAQAAYLKLAGVMIIFALALMIVIVLVLAGTGASSF